MAVSTIEGSRAEFFVAMDAVQHDVEALRVRTDEPYEDRVNELFEKHGANLAVHPYVGAIVRFVLSVDRGGPLQTVVAPLDTPVQLFGASMQVAANLLGEPVMATLPNDLDAHFAFVPGGDEQRYQAFFERGHHEDPAQL